jgi:hypothetical protein
VRTLIASVLRLFRRTYPNPIKALAGSINPSDISEARQRIQAEVVESDVQTNVVASLPTSGIVNLGR